MYLKGLFGGVLTVHGDGLNEMISRLLPSIALPACNSTLSVDRNPKVNGTRRRPLKVLINPAPNHAQYLL